MNNFLSSDKRRSGFMSVREDVYGAILLSYPRTSRKRPSDPLS